MKNIRDVILSNQENQDFMARVEHSVSIEDLYSVLCEYGYSSDIKKFEQEVYEILKNSDLVKNSVSDDELEKVSGGVNMRQKIMSIVTLTGLAVGGVPSFVDAKSQNTLRSEQYRQHKINKGLPPWEKLGLEFGLPTIGIVTLLSILGPKGIKYIKKQKSSEKEFTETNTNYINKMNIITDEIEFESMHETDEDDHEMSYEQALNIIKDFHKSNPQEPDHFPKKVIDAVELIEKTFFKESKPPTETLYMRKETNLKLFPRETKDCLRTEFFRPLSWNNGRGKFVQDDNCITHKTLFQYLCRMLTFLLEDHRPNQHWKKEWGYVYYLRGHDTYAEYKTMPNYQSLFACIESELQVRPCFESQRGEILKLVSTLRAMYNIALSYNQQETKCGVFCGNSSRRIDN